MQATQLQDHLYTLEERLLHPDRELDRTALIPLLSEDFKEFCSSGRIFNREQTIDAMLSSDARPATIHHFYVTQLSENIALATYRTTTPMVATHRSSLWIFRDNHWQLFFHQGTVAN